MKHFLLAIILTLICAGTSFAGKTTFTDGNKAAGQRGTPVTASFLNSVNSHRHDGGNYDGAGILDAALDTGTANAIVVNLSTPLTAHVPRMPVYVQVANANTGASTINISGLGAKPLKKKGNVDLAAGDLFAGEIIAVAYDGTNYQMLSSWSTTDATTLQGQSAGQLAPSGAIMAFAGSSCPNGWGAADGVARSRTVYASAFAAMGVTWGAGDGVNTFGWPDLRGEFLRGWDSGRGVDPGRAMASAQSDDLKSHSHSYGSGGAGQVDPHIGSNFTVSLPGSGSTGSTGGSETRPRNVAVLYCVKY